MLLELLTCALALFGTVSCDYNNDAIADEQFHELVLAYEKVLESSGDTKLRGLKHIHRQLYELAEKYPDADVSARIVSSDIAGINLLRVRNAIQKLDTNFDSHAETIAGGEVSSFISVKEPSRHNLTPHTVYALGEKKITEIEPKKAPKVALKAPVGHPPLTLPAPKPKREPAVLIAQITLPVAKPKVHPNRQPSKHLAPLMPRTNEWHMSLVPAAFRGDSPFKAPSTWNKLGLMARPSPAQPNSNAMAELQLDAPAHAQLDDNSKQQSKMENKGWYFAVGHTLPILESKNWGYESASVSSYDVLSHQNKKFDGTNAYSASFGKDFDGWGYELRYEDLGKAKWQIGETLRRDGTVFDSGYLDFKQRNLFLQAHYQLGIAKLFDTHLLVGLGRTEFDVGAGQLVKNGVKYRQGDPHSQNSMSYRLGLMFEQPISENVILVSLVSISDYGKIHNKEVGTGIKDYFVPRRSTEASLMLKYYIARKDNSQ